MKTWRHCKEQSRTSLYTFLKDNISRSGTELMVDAFFIWIKKIKTPTLEVIPIQAPVMHKCPVPSTLNDNFFYIYYSESF